MVLPFSGQRMHRGCLARIADRRRLRDPGSRRPTESIGITSGSRFDPLEDETRERLVSVDSQAPLRPARSPKLGTAIHAFSRHET